MLLPENTSLKSYIDNSTMIDIKPRVFAEWNGNSISTYKVHGTYVGMPNTISSTNLKSFTQVAPSPAPTVVARGEATPVFNDTNAQSMILGGSSASAKIDSKSAASGVVTIKLSSQLAISAGDAFVVDGLGAGYDGSFVAISGTTGSIVKYNSTNNSLTQSESRVSPSGNIRINGGSYVYTHTLGSGAKAVKFHLRLKSDYTHQSSTDPNFLEQFDVTIRVIGRDAEGIVYTQSLTKVFTVDSSDWTNAELMFANPDSPITQAEINLYFEGSQSKKAALLVDRFLVLDVSEYEVYISDRQPISEVFDIDRPGDLLIDRGAQSVTIGSETYTQQCSPVHMASSYALGDFYEKVQRSVVPFADNPYSYYTSGSDLDSKKIYCIYDRTIKTNKIVIKTNSIVTKPKVDKFTIKLLINGTWTSIATSGAVFSNNGTLVLYYNGSSWTTTRWGNVSVPSISMTTGSITSKLDIQGIAFECTELEFVRPTGNLNTSDAINFLELIEISPRLELDLTNITLGFSLNKELSSDNPLPLGNITSNTVSIDFSNIPVIIGDSDTRTSEESDIVPISQYSQTSPLYGMLVKGVKLKGYFDVDTTTSATVANAGKVMVPAFVMFSERWSENIDKVSVECFDAIKKLQSTPARPVYLENKTVNEIIYSVLDSVGFGDYYFETLNNLKVMKYSGGSDSENAVLKQSVDYFWANKDQSVTDTLNELFKPYQIGMFTDEYGGVVFTSLLEISNKTANANNLVYIQDKNHGALDGAPTNFKSNLKNISFEEIERPEKIIMRYRRPTPSISDFRQVKNKPNTSVVSRATDIVWEPESEAQLLTYFELGSPGILTETQSRIPFNVESAGFINRAIENIGYLLIDEEIVYYDGLEYIFTTPSDPSFYRIEDIRSTSDIERIISEIYQQKNTGDINWAPTGYMVNVQRGLFGTEPAKHIVLSPGSRVGWQGIEFNASYKGVSSIDQSDGTFGAAQGNIALKSEKTSGGLFIYPTENNKVGTKRKFFARYQINKIPSGKSGSMGVGIGVKVEGASITRGLFIWTGVESKNDETSVTISIIQMVNGQVTVVAAPKTFDFTTDLYSYEEPLELYVEFNNDMNKMKVFIGSTSLFEIVKPSKKDDETDRKVAFKTLTVDIAKIDKNGLFGFAALQQGRGVLDSMAFTVNNDPRNLNSIILNNSQGDYFDTDSKANPSFYIGASNVLNAIVYDQYIAGFNKFKDGFVYTGAPAARGIKIFEVDYQDFPVTSTPEVEFLGYTYTIDALRNSRILGGGEQEK